MPQNPFQSVKLTRSLVWAWGFSAIPALQLARPVSADLGWFNYGATAILICFFLGLLAKAVLSLLRSGGGGFGILAAIAIQSVVVVIIVGYFIRRGENIPPWLDLALSVFVIVSLKLLIWRTRFRVPPARPAGFWPRIVRAGEQSARPENRSRA